MKIKNKKVRNIIIAGVAVAFVAIGTITYFVISTNSKNAPNTTFTAVTVRSQSISISVAGSGTVSNSSQTDLIPATAGTLDSLSVKEGDTIKKGDTLGKVTDTSTITGVQTAETALSTATKALYTKAPVAGRVKQVSIAPGDDLSVIKGVGSTMVISTDGYLKTSISTSDASVTNGATVYVVVNGSWVQGTVSAASGSAGGAGNSGKSYDVLVPDTLPVGAAATVYKTDKTTVIAVGSNLAVNSAIQIQGPGNGVVSNVYVSENSEVAKGTNLFKLSSDSIVQQQNDLTNKQAVMTKDTLISPVDGVVATTYFNVGDAVAQGKPVLTVMDLTKMQTIVTVDELDIAKVKIGQAATITADAVTGKTFDGTVTRIASIGVTTNGVTTYSVTVAITKGDTLKVGMTTNVSIIIQKKDNILVVPINAVQAARGQGGSSKFVYSADGLIAATTNNNSNNKFAGASLTSRNKSLTTQAKVTAAMNNNKITVETGISNQTYIEITSGLKEGDVIVIPVVAVKSTTTAASTNSSTRTNAATSGFGGASGFSGASGASGFSGGNGGGASRGGN